VKHQARRLAKGGDCDRANELVGKCLAIHAGRSERQTSMQPANAANPVCSDAGSSAGRGEEFWQ